MFLFLGSGYYWNRNRKLSWMLFIFVWVNKWDRRWNDKSFSPVPEIGYLNFVDISISNICLQRLRSRSQKFMWWSITGRYHSISDCLVPRLYAKKFIFYFWFSIFLVTFFRVPKFVAKLKYLFLHLCLRISNWNQSQLTEKFQGTTQFIWH